MTNLETITGKTWKENVNNCDDEGRFSFEVSNLVEVQVNVFDAAIYVSTYKNEKSFNSSTDAYFTTGEGQEGQEKKLNEILSKLN